MIIKPVNALSFWFSEVFFSQIQLISISAYLHVQWTHLYIYSQHKCVSEITKKKIVLWDNSEQNKQKNMEKKWIPCSNQQIRWKNTLSMNNPPFVGTMNIQKKKIYC